MTKQREIRWKIDAPYTRETMPLGRLLAYLTELASMLGEEHNLHLIRIENSSTAPVLAIDEDVADRVHERATAVRYGTAPRASMQSFRNINRMLTEDRGTATLFEGGAEIIPFPGHAEEHEGITGIQQHGNLDGVLLKVGGAKEWVPIQLQMPDETVFSGCYAKRTVAKRLGSHLFEPIRLFGRGRWNRGQGGAWRLDRFYVDNFDPLNGHALPEVVASLRAVRGEWVTDDPIADLITLRHGEDEDEDE